MILFKMFAVFGSAISSVFGPSVFASSGVSVPAFFGGDSSLFLSDFDSWGGGFELCPFKGLPDLLLNFSACLLHSFTIYSRLVSAEFNEKKTDPGNSIIITRGFLFRVAEVKEYVDEEIVVDLGVRRKVDVLLVEPHHWVEYEPCVHHYSEYWIPDLGRVKVFASYQNIVINL